MAINFKGANAIYPAVIVIIVGFLFWLRPTDYKPVKAASVSAAPASVQPDVPIYLADR